MNINSCKKDDPEHSPTPTPNPVVEPWDQTFSKTSDGYFRATINGTEVKKRGSESYGWGGLLGTPSNITFSSFLENDNSDVIATVYIGRINLPSGGWPYANDLKNYAKEGAYTFGIPETPAASTFNSEVQYTDATGTTWGTAFGTGAQSGASFNITDTLHTTLGNGAFSVKFKATFNCTLYNFNNSQTMTLTNGTYVGYITEYDL